jgi:phosphate-selective porin OprO/OprP
MVPAVQAAEEVGIRGPLGARAYLQDGIHFDSPKDNIRLKINGKVAFDGGSIFADRELQEAFPGLEGDHADLRTLQFSLRGWLGKGLEFRLSIDFANVRQIKDNWVRFTRVPLLRHFRIGNLEQPYSLEELTSSQFRSFMETSLSTYAFAPGRDIGFFTGGLAKEGRMTWSDDLVWRPLSEHRIAEHRW